MTSPIRINWGSSHVGIEAMARMVGMWPARGNESWADLRYRIEQRLLRGGQPAGCGSRPWYETALGIKTKGMELGLNMEAGESLPHFLFRVAERLK
jgi:hypothetical protein